MQNGQKAVAGSIAVHLLFFTLTASLGHLQFPQQELPPAPIYISLREFYQPLENAAPPPAPAPLGPIQPQSTSSALNSGNQQNQLKPQLSPRTKKKLAAASKPKTLPEAGPVTKESGSRKNSSGDNHPAPAIPEKETGSPAPVVAASRSTTDRRVNGLKPPAAAIETGENEAYLAENLAKIRELIAKNVVFPPIARKLGWHGKLTVTFALDSAGNASAIRIVESSGKELLDRNVIAAIKRTAPFPSPKRMITLVLPVTYNLK